MSPPGDFTVVLRVLEWPGQGEAVEAAVRACGGSSWSAAAVSAGGASAAYSGRFDRLGVPVEARGVLVPREGQSLLLEVEAPVAKGHHVAELYERWVARHAGSAPPGSSRNGLPPRVRIAKGAEALSALARGAGSGYRLGP